MLRSSYPVIILPRKKIELTPDINVDDILEGVKVKYKKQPINTVDGVKVEFDREWVHLRKSNTEPIIRIYAESQSMTHAQNLADKLIMDIKDMISELAR
jgi:phosphomannomutase